MTVAPGPSLAIESIALETRKEEWVEIQDPQSGNIFYANPHTGECSWEEPVNAHIKPRNPAGEWWELFDETHGLPYYYNTYSGQTEWLRPAVGTVIPLHALQNSSIGKRVSMAISDRASRVLSTEDVDFNKLEQMYGKQQRQGVANRQNNGTYRNTPSNNNLTNGQTYARKQQSQQGASNCTVETPCSSIYSDGKMSETSSYSTQYTSMTSQQHQHQQQQHHRYRSQGATSSAMNATNNNTYASKANASRHRPHASAHVSHTIPQISCSNIDDDPDMAMPIHPMLNQSSRSTADTQAQANDAQQSQQLSLQQRRKMQSATANGASSQNLQAYDRSRNIARSASAIDLKITDPETIATQENELYVQPAHTTVSAMEFRRNVADDYPRSAGLLRTDGYNNQNQMENGSIPMSQSPSAKSAPPSRRSPISTSLPMDLRDDPTIPLQIDGFAKMHFAIHKKGLFRRKVPVEKMLQWSKESLKLPLLALDKNSHRDALKIFKIIQRIMGDRPRMRGSTAVEDIQWVLERGLQQAELRDEIYVQLCKQVTANPNSTSVLKGWELLSVVCVTFPSSKNFEDYLKCFIQQHFNEPDNIGIMAMHCYKKLIRIINTGPKGKAPTFGEIEHAKAAAFNPTVFGESLDVIMEMQEKDFPNLPIPRILAFLAEGILDLNGQQSEGIFRVPGDTDFVTNLKLRIEKNNYDLAGITDPNVPASLLKFWLRDLADPLIPGDCYRECISNAEDAKAALAIVDCLPEINRQVTEYIIGFLQVFAQPECSQRTKMTIDNLAMVFAPNFLRCPTSSLTQIFENTRHEQAFVKTLILHMQCKPIGKQAT